MVYKVKDSTFSTRLDQAMVSVDKKENNKMSLRQAEIAFGVKHKTISVSSKAELT